MLTSFYWSWMHYMVFTFEKKSSAHALVGGGIFHYRWWTVSIKPRLLFSPCRLCFQRTSFSSDCLLIRRLWIHLKIICNSNKCNVVQLLSCLKTQWIETHKNGMFLSFFCHFIYFNASAYYQAYIMACNIVAIYFVCHYCPRERRKLYFSNNLTIFYLRNFNKIACFWQSKGGYKCT